MERSKADPLRAERKGLRFGSVTRYKLDAETDGQGLAKIQSKESDQFDESFVLRKLLLGTKTNSRVESRDGGFAIDEGETITPEVIDKAQKHDVLLLLTIHVDI